MSVYIAENYWTTAETNNIENLWSLKIYAVVIMIIMNIFDIIHAVDRNGNFAWP